MFVLELSVSGAPDAVAAWEAQQRASLAALPGVALAEGLYPYENLGAAAAYHDAEPAAPVVMIVLGFATEADLVAALDAPALRGAIDALPFGAHLEAAAFRRHRHGLPDDDLRQGGGTSYVVRYRLPCAEAEAFVAEYLAGHLPIQSDFPGIRRILGFEPIAAAPEGSLPAGYLVGNEVTFDDLESFVAAMASDVLPRLKAHSQELPPRQGICTHHLMQRRPLA
jgi:hypothetical protein